MNLKVEYGNVSFEAEKQLTIAEVAALAEAAKLIGVPSNAVVTALDYRWGASSYPDGVRVNLSWRMPEETP
jgi:hypothetical protein